MGVKLWYVCIWLTLKHLIITTSGIEYKTIHEMQSVNKREEEFRLDPKAN